MSPAQELKKWFLKNFLDRVEKVRVTKQRVAEVISSLEKHARESYRDIDTGVTEYEFSEIMLLDGCFIVELLLSQDYKDFGTSTLVGNTEKVPFLTLQQDLLKIENQLPFNVLKHLADLALSNNSQAENPKPDGYPIQQRRFHNPSTHNPGIHGDAFLEFPGFQMSSTSSRIFTSYVVLMDTLINNEKDVEVLLRSKILLSRDNDIRGLVSLFNDLSANVRQKDFYFEPLIQKVNRYCGSGFRPQRAYMVRNYYDARWDVLNNALFYFYSHADIVFCVVL
ncbi:hypothetical protein DH2020_031398 [Rehmannia glutinosa]|uniref:Uncharacterized protein n=1 Tax=Rehmannia glutinosa TaxID=99300 RepID=A0ABR0VIV5_REHGL